MRANHNRQVGYKKAEISFYQIVEYPGLAAVTLEGVTAGVHWVKKDTTVRDPFSS
jgi:hypothetical protein